MPGHVHRRSSGLGPVCPACGLGFDSDSALRRHQSSPAAAQACRSASDGDWTHTGGTSGTAEPDSDIEAMWDDRCEAADALPVEPANQVPITTI